MAPDNRDIDKMTEAAAMFTRILGTTTAATQEEKLMIDILYNNNITLLMGDKRLNNITALTWNSGQCDNIFKLLEKSLNPEKYPWQTLHKSILLLHTITMFGSEIAIDACIQLFRTIDKLQSYNSALVKQGGFFAVGGMDYGSPVRDAAKVLVGILVNDENIRHARQTATQSAESLVPLGEDFDAIAIANAGKSNAAAHEFGQGMQTSSLGAGFDLSHVPGMYEDRPDRYFDDKLDSRQNLTVGDHQSTREAMNTESLLDLVFDTDTNDQGGGSSLPENTDYLPALAKQKELEAQLAAQQEQLQQLHRLQQQQQQLQQQQQQQQQHMNPTQFMGHHPSALPQQMPDNVFNNFQSPQQMLQQTPVSGNMMMNDMQQQQLQQQQQQQHNLQPASQSMQLGQTFNNSPHVNPQYQQQFQQQQYQPQQYQPQQYQHNQNQQQQQQQQPMYGQSHAMLPNNQSQPGTE